MISFIHSIPRFNSAIPPATRILKLNITPILSLPIAAVSALAVRTAFSPILEALTVLLRASRFPAFAALVQGHRPHLPRLHIPALSARTLLTTCLPAAETLTVFGFAERLHTSAFNGLLLGSALEQVVDFAILYIKTSLLK